MNSEFQAPVTT